MTNEGANQPLNAQHKAVTPDYSSIPRLPTGHTSSWRSSMSFLSSLNSDDDGHDHVVTRMIRNISFGHPVGQVFSGDTLEHKLSFSVPKPRLGVIALVGLTFFNVSGGAFGTEQIISSGGPLIGIIGNVTFCFYSLSPRC